MMLGWGGGHQTGDGYCTITSIHSALLLAHPPLYRSSRTPLPIKMHLPLYVFTYLPTYAPTYMARYIYAYMRICTYLVPTRVLLNLRT